jgi:carboxyl-terminal processing protease
LDLSMSSYTRRLVFWISTPVMVFVVIGGFLNRVTAREDTYQQLKIFDDVVGLIDSNYVEKVEMAKVMRGAMRGLADSLDPDSAFISAERVKQIETGAALPPGDVGLDLTRQYYLRVIAARDGSPAAKAGLRTGDFVRAIDDTPTREMSVFDGMRALRGAVGSKVTLTIIRGNSNDPHTVELVRQAEPTVNVTSRMAGPTVGYLRVAAFGQKTVDQAKAQVGQLRKGGATSLVVDIRQTSGGAIDQGIALARLFVPTGTLAVRETRGAASETIAAAPGDGDIKLPVTLLVNAGTSSAAEVFASALVGNDRADLVGEHTLGRAGQQRLVRLPDGTGLWMTTTRYLTPTGSPLHEKGLAPTVEVEEPDVEFGQTPASDPALEKAVEHAAGKKAA